MARIPGQLEGAQLENLSSDPTNLPDGRSWLNTTTGQIKTVVAGVVKVLSQTTATETLTNKTLTSPTITGGALSSPAITTPTGIVKGDVGLGNVDNTSDVNKPVSTAQATADSAVQAYSIQRANHTGTQSVATITGLGTMATQAASSVAITGGSIAGTKQVLFSDTLTNLTALVRSAGAIYYATDTKKEYVDDGTNLVAVGSGSGSGGINYITNSDAEINTSGFATYNNTAGIAPVNGTGGSPLTTFTRETIASGWAPIRGVGSDLLSKPSSNRQGDGVSYALTIDPADKGKVLQFTVDYAVATGTYDGQVIAYLYDVTNSTLIYPMDGDGTLANHSLPSAQYRQRFQTAYNSTSYRLILHVASTSTSVFALYFDNWSFGPQALSTGAVITDWVTYTPTIGGSTTAPTFGTSTISAQWRRVGSNIELRYNAQQTGAGTSGSGTYLFGLPSGVTIDTTKAKVSTSGVGLDGQIVGVGAASLTTASSTSPASPTIVVPYNSTNVAMYSQPSAVQLIPVGSGQYSLGNTTVYFTFSAQIPVLGWLTNVAMSSDASTSQIIARATSSATTASTSAPIVVNGILSYDSSGSYSTVTGRFTCPSAGTYDVSAYIKTNSTSWTSGQAVELYLYKNGSQYSILNTFTFAGSVTTPGAANGSDSVQCIAGDILDVRAYSSNTIALDGNAAHNYVTFSKKSGSQTIAATDRICATYGLTTAASVLAAGVIKYDTKVEDTNGIYSPSTGLLTSNFNGKLRIIVVGSLNFTGASLICKKNGTGVGYIVTIPTSGYVANGTIEILVSNGDTVGIYSDSPATASATTANGYLNQVTFERAT